MKKNNRFGTISTTSTLAGWTSKETANISINFAICNQGWKLAEILAHESYHSRTGEGFFHEEKALKYGYGVRTDIFPSTGGTLYYGHRSNLGWW